MKKELISEFKALFEEQKKSLVYSQSILNRDFNTNPEDLADEVDLTATENERSMRLRLRNRESLYLKKINEALRRISAGTFGECHSCGEDIEHRRLLARPTATFCVNCKEEQERSEASHIDGIKHKSVGHLRLA